MNHFYPFNSEAFTKDVKDYEIDETGWCGGSLRRAVFTPLKVKCIVRIKDLTKEDRDLLENECQLDSMIVHSNVINIMTTFVNGPNLYTVLPLSKFPSLDELCQPYGLVEPIIALVVVDVLRAMDYLHNNNIIHRAIMASHTLMFGTFETNVKFVLTGFKYSLSMMSQANKQAYDHPKAASKMLHALAPEILEQNTSGYNYKSDIYSLGILCCQLANGVIPFDNMDTEEMLFSKLIGDAPKPIDANHEEMIVLREYAEKMEFTLKRRYINYSKRKFSHSFHEFVSSCLHIEPTRRASADELLNHHWIMLTRARLNRDEEMALLKTAAQRHM